MMTGTFLRVKCKCGNEQKIFDCVTSIVNCSKCNEPLAHPTGGKAVIHGEIIEELE